MKKLALLCAFALAFACNETKNKAPTSVTAGAGEPSPDTVVATFGNGQKITLGEVDTEAGDQLAQLDQQKFKLRKQTLDSLVAKKLIDAEAAKKGQTEEQFLQSYVDSKVPRPSDEEMKKLFDDAQSGGKLPPNATFDEYKDKIADFMTQQKKGEVVRGLLDDLKKNANVEVKFSEPRKVVEAKGPSRGPDNAKVTIVEFSDFQCPFCGRAHDTVEQVMQTYAGKVHLVFRQYPLPFHEHAAKAAEAALCANEQGKFWEYHDVLFKNQQKLEIPDLKEHAAALGLDAGKFNTCLDSAKYANAVKEDQAAGTKAGVSGTPAFFINGVLLSGAQPFDAFKEVIDQELKGS